MDSNSPSSYTTMQKSTLNPTCKFISIEENNLHRNIHTFRIPSANRATRTYTAKICDCTLGLIVSQPPLPAEVRPPPHPSLVSQPLAALLHQNTQLWQFLSASFGGVFFFHPLFVIRERPPRCIGPLTEMPSRSQWALGHPSPAGASGSKPEMPAETSARF